MLSDAKIQAQNVSNWQEKLKMYAGPKINLDQQTIKSRKNIKLKQNEEAQRERAQLEEQFDFMRLDSCDVIETSRPLQHSGRGHPDRPQVQTEKKSNKNASTLELVDKGGKPERRVPYKG